MGIFNIFRRRKSDDEALRRAELLRTGRIAEATISDVVTDDSDRITQIFFNYTINGVDYESSQTLDPEQQRRQGDYFPGARVTLRYNYQRPGNSVVV
jgi:hypothetical protein